MRRFVLFTVVVIALAWGLQFAHAQPSGPIIRLDPALDALVSVDAKLEKLAGDFKPALEGGVWVRDGNYLLFSNKGERLINKWTPEGTLSVYLNLAELAKIDDQKVSLSSGTTLDAQGRLVYCSQGEHAIFRVERDGSRTKLADSYDGQRFGSPNDLVYKSNGTLYFTDNLTKSDAYPRSAYMLKNGQVTVITREPFHPNGIALSPDERYLYVNDSGGGGKRTVWRFDVQPDDTAINGRIWVDMSSDPAKGIPDGMKVDTKGNVWDGGPGGLWILSPEGKHLGTVLTPDQLSNLAFGDADGKSVFMTLHSALYRLRVKVRGLIP